MAGSPTNGFSQTASNFGSYNPDSYRKQMEADMKAGKPQMPTILGFNPTAYNDAKTTYDAQMTECNADPEAYRQNNPVSDPMAYRQDLSYNPQISGQIQAANRQAKVPIVDYTQAQYDYISHPQTNNPQATTDQGSWQGGMPLPNAQPQQDQQQPFNVNIAASQGIQDAMNTTGGELNYRPMAINAPSQYDLAQYTNPYENQVVQQSLSDLERSRLIAKNVDSAQAGAASAFGGSRHGIAESETNRAFADQVARTSSGLRQTGYQNAQDMARQAQIQNQAAGLSGSQQRLNASSQLGSLSNLGFGMGQQIQDRMDRQGGMQQLLQQELINAAKGQYADYTGSPAESLQYLLNAVGGAPAVGSVTDSKEMGLMDYLKLGAGIKAF